MSVGDALYAISEAGLTLNVSPAGDTLKVYPAENITPKLAAAIREHKADLILSPERTRRCAAPASSSPSARSLRWPANTSA